MTERKKFVYSIQLYSHGCMSWNDKKKKVKLKKTVSGQHPHENVETVKDNIVFLLVVLLLTFYYLFLFTDLCANVWSKMSSALYNIAITWLLPCINEYNTQIRRVQDYFLNPFAPLKLLLVWSRAWPTPQRWDWKEN